MEYAPSNRKRLPYGMMNFADIRFDNYYYVDKTAFIPLIEQSDRFFFFIRPLLLLSAFLYLYYERFVAILLLASFYVIIYMSDRKTKNQNP